MTEKNKGYIKRECSFVCSLAICKVVEEDNLDWGDMWNADPYVEAIVE